MTDKPKLLSCLFITALFGCDTQGYVIRNAVNVCADHGGIGRIVWDLGERNVECADGLMVVGLAKMRSGGKNND